MTGAGSDRPTGHSSVVARRTFRPWKPYSPPKPPVGSYDPSLDAAREAANRGFGDVRQDVETAGTRADVDYGLGREQIGRDYDRYNDDYHRNTAMLKRSFERLGTRQAESMNQAGVLSPGAALESAAKRAANQQTQQDELNTNYKRAGEDRDLAYGQLDLGYQRGGLDRTRTLERAGRENTAFGLDTGAQIAFGASQGGYVPPRPGEPGGGPSGLFTNKAGAQRRRIVKGGVEYIVAPDGTVVHKRKVG